MLPSIGEQKYFVLGCEFNFKEQGGFFRIVIVAQTAAGPFEPLGIIEGESWGVRFTDLQKNFVHSALARNLQEICQQGASKTAPAVLGGNSEIQDFSFAAKIVPLQDRDDFAGGFAQVRVSARP